MCDVVSSIETRFSPSRIADYIHTIFDVLNNIMIVKRTDTYYRSSIHSYSFAVLNFIFYCTIQNIQPRYKNYYNGVNVVI